MVGLDAIIEAIRMYLGNVEHNPFYFEQGFARVITGQAEGFYGWVTVNVRWSL